MVHGRSGNRSESIEAYQLIVGRQCNNRFRITVHESCLAPNSELEIKDSKFHELQGFDLETLKPAKP
jgi:hypothetical protein